MGARLPAPEPQLARKPAPAAKPLRLEDMNWEQRFMEAWKALLVMECRAERAELKVKMMEEEQLAANFRRALRRREGILQT